MRRWLPQPSAGRWLAVALLIATLAGALALALRLGLALAQPPERWPVNLAFFAQLLALVGLLLLAGGLAYRVASAFTLAYELDRNGLYINWIGNRAVVPLAQIESVDVGAPGAQLPWRPLQGIGYYWGRGRTANGRRLHLFATLPLERCLVLHTASDSYAVSPLDQDSFVQDLEQRRKLGAIKPLAPALEPGRIFFYEFWNDPLVRWALLLAFGLNLLLLGLVAARYPQLGASIEIRFNAAGELAELRPRHQVLFLPLAACVLSLVNTGLGLMLYLRERTGAQLLQAASVLLQLLFGIAALRVII